MQRQLTEFLNSELLHSLGVYGLACDKLERLQGELGDSAVEEELEVAVEASYRCNDHLRNGLHRQAGDGDAGPALGRRPSPFPEGKEPSLLTPELLKGVSAFYVDAAAALTLHFEDQDMAKKKYAPPGHRLGACFAFIHDPQRRGKVTEPQSDALIQGKIDRTWARLEDLHDLIPSSPRPRRPPAGSNPSAERIRSFQRILDGCAGGKHDLLLTIVQALSEAHMWMHQAEHVRAQSFGPMFSSIPETHAEAQRMLRYSLALNTFVFVAARAVPWIFSEDEDERDHVIHNYEDSCNMLAPTYCMWISVQFSLLALHRRAFTWWTMGKHDRAYRDFHKLTRLLRGLRQPAEKRGLRVPGTKTFIEGMTGMSELHIGRIYRGQHAHRMALRYFDRASRHLKGWEDHGEIGPVIKNSQWRLNLLLNEGKANYELGHIKRSMLYYAQAWRAFLLLVESETHATANIDVVEEFVEWLEPIVDEPELSRRELRIRIEPLVRQFVTLRSPIHLRLLAADLVMRMGHLLFILRLAPAKWVQGADGEPPETNHDLARECMEQAAVLDPTSTLTASDLLKIQHETGKKVEPNPTPLAEHWPSGSGRFEEAARITEYTLQEWLARTSPVSEPLPASREKVARELLGSFLAHTDSSNVKLAQVYRYLMRDGRAKKRKTSAHEHTLDFVCLRRYSSFFPFLPRPSAFRAAGGGYFAQVREAGEDAEPFGIAIDPGPDFIENLYRCGYSLADIHLIVLTHDHADHIASVDAMLALMGIRKGLGDDTFDRKEKRRLAIVGNESVYQRYAFFGEPHPLKRDPKKKKGEKNDPRADAVRVLRFEDVERLTKLKGEKRSKAVKKKEILPFPESLRIEPVQTWGHTDANGYVSQGFLLHFGPADDESSILFTGDTGIPPTGRKAKDKAVRRMFAGGSKTLRDAVKEADVVVAHLSSVPLRELRELANLRAAGEGPDETISEYTKLWAKAAENADSDSEDQDTRKGIELTQFLLNQIQFGFRSRPGEKRKDFGVSPFTDFKKLRKQPEQHLYLTGLIELAELMADASPERAPLLLIGELREELGTFRTRIASRIAESFFDREDEEPSPSALTTDIGLRVRISRPSPGPIRPISVLCTTCDLDNDLMPAERFHRPAEIHEVCVKGEDEAVFYNCPLHDPRHQEDYFWLESVERFDIFGE